MTSVPKTNKRCVLQKDPCSKTALAGEDDDGIHSSRVESMGSGLGSAEGGLAAGGLDWGMGLWVAILGSTISMCCFVRKADRHVKEFQIRQSYDLRTGRLQGKQDL